MTNYYPVEEELEAYTSDLLLLFKNFDQTESLRFEDFSKEWRALNFSFIHCGRKSSGDHHQGTERLLRCISGFLNPETPFQYRIAAVYAAYGVYYTQLCNPKVKIRMTVPMWKDLKNLQELVREHKHRDVDYIINKLENDKAFVFTAMPKQLEYGSKELMTNTETSGGRVNTSRKYYAPDQYVEDTIKGLDFVERIACLEDEYLAAKEEISTDLSQTKDSNDRKIASYLKSIKDLRSAIVDDMENFREWVETNTQSPMLFDSSQRPAAKAVTTGKEKVSQPCTEPAEEESVVNSRADRVQALKRRSFRNPVTGDTLKESPVPTEGGECSKQDAGEFSKQDVGDNVRYRRSALLERREMRPWLRGWKSRQKKPKLDQ